MNLKKLLLFYNSFLDEKMIQSFDNIKETFSKSVLFNVLNLNDSIVFESESFEIKFAKYETENGQLNLSRFKDFAYGSLNLSNGSNIDQQTVLQQVTNLLF